LQRLPRPPSWIKGALLVKGRGRGEEREKSKGTVGDGVGREGRGREGRGGEGRGEKGKGGEGDRHPQPSLIRPCLLTYFPIVESILDAPTASAYAYRL